MDTWTDRESLNFMSVTAHYIAAPEASPQEWELRSVQIALTRVEGRHTGENLARILVRVIDKYGFRHNVSFCWFPRLSMLTWS
jgi:hypothetical protein